MRYQAALRPDIQYSNRMKRVLFLSTQYFYKQSLSTFESMSSEHPSLPWLEPGHPFPPVEYAWPRQSEAPGLLAVGGSLSTDTLMRAYGHGIFPWFSDGQPILWWSPDPRMALRSSDFRLHRSLRKTLLRFKNDANCGIRFDTAFAQVIQACASAPRNGQRGTWILPTMVQSYIDLHHAGHVHSIETWINGELVGGLYCVALGHAVFGESMFAKVPDASKIALAALVGFCREHAIQLIDCQQNTAHLASLGAKEMPRREFIAHIALAQKKPNLDWRFSPLYWQHVLSV